MKYPCLKCISIHFFLLRFRTNTIFTGIVALILGVLETMLLGMGMCCTMVWSDLVFFCILIGCIGIVLIVSAYPSFKKVIQKRREKIAPQILALSEELLNS